MKQGGKIHFATDFFDYSVQAKILFILHPDFEIVNTHLPEEVFLSIFANKFKKWERPFYCISAEKK